jgi:His-Xaa-Ser system protein HxsD
MSPVEDVPCGGAGEITLIFDQATVDLDALQRSVYAVAAAMTVDIRVSGTDYVCTLFPRRPGVDEEPKHRFRMEVNDQILRSRIAKETEPLRNLVFALAFSQTGLADAGDEGERDAEDLPTLEVEA